MIDAMPKKLPPHVVMQRTRHGRVVFYFRIGKGKRTRLQGAPGSAEFKAAYDAALRGEASQRQDMAESGPARSIRWLIDQHRKSAAWVGLAVATRKQRENIFAAVIAKAGNVDFRKIDRRAVQNGMDDRASTPAQANVYLKAMRSLFAWAVDAGHLDQDPTQGVKPLKYRSEGFAPWTAEDGEAFCDHWKIGTMERLAFELAAISGLCRSDLHRVGRQHLRGNVLMMDTAKTGATIAVEIPEDVMRIIEATPSGALHFIVGKNGKPYGREGFGNWFRKASRVAGVEKPLHGVRKFAATSAAEGGASDREMMAQFGWTTPAQAGTYTKKADRVRLGIASSRKVAERKKNA